MEPKHGCLGLKEGMAWKVLRILAEAQDVLIELVHLCEV